MRPSTRAALSLTVMLASSCSPRTATPAPAAAASSEGAEAAPTASPAPLPNRPRFQHVPRAYPAAKVRAAKITAVLVDNRSGVRAATAMLPAMALPQDGETLPVAAVADYAALVQGRLDQLASHEGPELKLSVEVKRLDAARHGDTRRLDIELSLTVLDASDQPLVRGVGQGNKELFGPPYDATELDDLHRSVCLDALDVFLASEANIALINERVGP
jgi:hypothetical protein